MSLDSVPAPAPTEAELKATLAKPAGTSALRLGVPVEGKPAHVATHATGPKDEDLLKQKEAAILALGKLYSDRK